MRVCFSQKEIDKYFQNKERRCPYCDGFYVYRARTSLSSMDTVPFARHYCCHCNGLFAVVELGESKAMHRVYQPELSVIVAAKDADIRDAAMRFKEVANCVEHFDAAD